MTPLYYYTQEFSAQNPEFLREAVWAQVRLARHLALQYSFTCDGVDSAKPEFGTLSERQVRPSYPANLNAQAEAHDLAVRSVVRVLFAMDWEFSSSEGISYPINLSNLRKTYRESTHGPKSVHYAGFTWPDIITRWYGGFGADSSIVGRNVGLDRAPPRSVKTDKWLPLTEE